MYLLVITHVDDCAYSGYQRVFLCLFYFYPIHYYFSLLSLSTKNKQVALCLTIYPIVLLSQILVANKMACELFGYPSEELVGMKMSSLLSIHDRNQPEAIMEQHVEANGELVMVSGKVVGCHGNMLV